MSADMEPVIDAEVVSVDRAEAERLDKRIRLLAGSINDSLAKLYELVERAKVGEIHAVLGFPSWTAYVADVFGGQVLLDREQRRELVGYLSGEGMSQRAIAVVVHADQKTVSNDLRSAREEVGGALCAATRNAREENSSPEPTPTTGLDGKTYPKPPEPSKPRRGPITDDFDRAVSDLTRVANRIGRLGADDRFNKNREVLSCRASDITRSIQLLLLVLAELHEIDQLYTIGHVLHDLTDVEGGHSRWAAMHGLPPSFGSAE
jgi:hypothetical protein